MACLKACHLNPEVIRRSPLTGNIRRNSRQRASSYAVLFRPLAVWSFISVHFARCRTPPGSRPAAGAGPYFQFVDQADVRSGRVALGRIAAPGLAAENQRLVVWHTVQHGLLLRDLAAISIDGNPHAAADRDGHVGPLLGLENRRGGKVEGPAPVSVGRLEADTGPLLRDDQRRPAAGKSLGHQTAAARQHGGLDPQRNRDVRER